MELPPLELPPPPLELLELLELREGDADRELVGCEMIDRPCVVCGTYVVVVLRAGAGFVRGQLLDVVIFTIVNPRPPPTKGVVIVVELPVERFVLSEAAADPVGTQAHAQMQMMTRKSAIFILVFIFAPSSAQNLEAGCVGDLISLSDRDNNDTIELTGQVVI